MLLVPGGKIISVWVFSGSERRNHHGNNDVKMKHFHDLFTEYAFTPDPTITFRTLGGVLDFFVFLGPSPENVVQQYTGVMSRVLNVR